LTTTFIIIIAILSLTVGFIIAWAMRTVTLSKVKKLKNSIEGFLESEKRMKETLQKENTILYQTKQIAENDFLKKINEASAIIKMQEEDILLLQKSNEETEAAMQAGLPGLNELKLKLLEANNTIARFKGQVESKEKVFRNSDNS
jgi:hypothetical protein